MQMKSIACIILLNLISLALAGVECAVPDFSGTPMPYYFSGTNCRTGGCARITAGSTDVTRIQIWLNGELTLDKTYPLDPDVLLAEADQFMMFDSTHFAPGSAVAVTVKAWAVDRGTGEESYNEITSPSVPVKNKVLTAQFPEDDFGDPGTIVRSMLATSYDSSFLIGYWTCREFVDDLNGPNVVTYCGHGGADFFYAGHSWPDAEVDHPTYVLPYGDDDYIVGHPDWLKQVGIEPYRIPQMGTGRPPYNSTAVPPVNLAYLDACNCGFDNNYIRFCIPYLNDYGLWLEDQCVLAYKCFIKVVEAEKRTQTLFSSLTAGMVVDKAKKVMLMQGFLASDDDVIWRPLAPGDLAIYGDKFTRITGVYTGDPSPSSGWFRPLVP